MQRGQGLDFVSEHVDAQSELLINGNDLNGVATNTECSPFKRDVVALILHLDEGFDECLAGYFLADLERNHRFEIVLRRTEAIDAGHRRHHHNVTSAQQRVGGRVPQALYLCID